MKLMEKIQPKFFSPRWTIVSHVNHSNGRSKMMLLFTILQWHRYTLIYIAYIYDCTLIWCHAHMMLYAGFFSSFFLFRFCFRKLYEFFGKIFFFLSNIVRKKMKWNRALTKKFLSRFKVVYIFFSIHLYVKNICQQWHLWL